MASQAQTAANQANAQKSTGPVTTAGKETVAKNALKTGLTGHTVLLPSDDAELYAKHVESFRSRYNPVGDAETELVQSIADTNWRLARIPGLEAGIYAVGRIKFADLHAKEQDPQVRAQLIETEIYLAYERQLRNLQVQEGRLRRNLEKDMAALKEMQETRIAEAKARLVKAAKAYVKAFEAKKADKFDLGEFGFEFSIDEIQAEVVRLFPDDFIQA